MGWFPVFADLMEQEEFKGLTPTEKIYFWHLVSEFNRRGEFYQSDLEIAKTLATSEKTIRRGRAKLVQRDLIEVKPGTRTKRNQYLATRYLRVRYATMDEDGFFAQMPRHTFNAMLDRLRKSRLQTGDVVVYVSLYYWFWRNRGKYESRDRFFITKKSLQSLTILKDASTRLARIYEAIVFSGGGHLFNYQEEYQQIIFRDWSWCADPDDDEQNRHNAEIYLKEIKDLVAREKRERQLKIQKKIVKKPKTSNDHVPNLTLISVFEELYKKKYGRWPNYRSTHRLKEIEQTLGRGAIYQAINWYFAADIVPNESGARTRTLGNFTTHIDEILKLSGKSAFV